MISKNLFLNFLQYFIIILMILVFTNDSYLATTEKIKPFDLTQINLTGNNIINITNYEHINFTNENITKIKFFDKSNIYQNFYAIIIIDVVLLLVTIFYIVKKDDVSKKLNHIIFISLICLLVIVLLADNINYDLYNQHISIVLQWIRGN